MADLYLSMKLQKMDLFKSLSADTINAIADVIEVEDVVADQVIYEENDPPTGLYMIASGEVAVNKGGKVIAHLKTGQHFGELALLDHQPRAATITATEDGVLFYLSQEHFDRICDEIPEVLKLVIQGVLGYLRYYIEQTHRNRP